MFSFFYKSAIFDSLSTCKLSEQKDIRLFVDFLYDTI